jgi:hypothetical protein
MTKAVEPVHVPTGTLEPHPATRMVPPMRADEWHAFRNDIEARGILVPLQVDSRGRVIDGAHRLQAARELGLPTVPVVRAPLADDTDDDAITLFVLRNALHRRHLSDDQRAVLAAKAAEYLTRLSRKRRAQAAAAARWGEDGSGDKGESGGEDKDRAPAPGNPPARGQEQEQGQPPSVSLPVPGERVRAAVAKEFGVSEKKIRQAQELLAADRARAGLVMKGQEKLNRALRDYRREGPYLPPGTPGAPRLERVTATDPTLLQREVFELDENGRVRSRWVPVPAARLVPAQAPAQTEAQTKAQAPATDTVTVPLDPAGAAAVLVEAFTPDAVRELARLLVSWLMKQGHIGESGRSGSET